MPHVRLILPALIALAAGATPAGACTISANGVAFGAYNPRTAAARTGFGRISLDCHPNSRPDIALGTGASGSFSQRRMSNGRSSLIYNLYTDAGMTTVWGNGSGGTVTVPTPKRGGTFTVYGRIPASQNVTAGSYSDVLVVTVTF